MFVMGPAIGYIAGGIFLDFYTDFDVTSPDEMVGLTNESQLWVGAWWLGFVIGWLMSWSCALLISLYPAVLPGAGKHNQVKPECVNLLDQP